MGGRHLTQKSALLGERVRPIQLGLQLRTLLLLGKRVRLDRTNVCPQCLNQPHHGSGLFLLGNGDCLHPACLLTQLEHLLIRCRDSRCASQLSFSTPLTQLLRLCAQLGDLTSIGCGRCISSCQFLLEHMRTRIGFRLSPLSGNDGSLAWLRPFRER